MCNLHVSKLHRILPKLEFGAVHDQPGLPIDLQLPAHCLEVILQGVFPDQVVIHQCDLVLDLLQGDGAAVCEPISRCKVPLGRSRVSEMPPWGDGIEIVIILGSDGY